jgi:short-subunit dehydrogenase
MKINLENKTAIITGASRGLGPYLAQRFMDAGANLILISRSRDTLSQLRDRLLLKAKYKQTIEILVGDLADTQDLSIMLDRITKTSPLHILVNNAAVQGPIGPVWENDWQIWQSALQVNLLSPIALCRAVIPKMIENNYGKIINLSGGGATHARPKFSSYAVAKVGLVRFSETLAKEVLDYNISVNCIAPGMMNTDLLAEIVDAGIDVAGEHEFTQAKNNTATDHAAEKNAAELCVFLSSSYSDGITGKLISAVWDPWKNLSQHLHDLSNSDIYTLRRIIPKDRGKSWGDNL